LSTTSFLGNNIYNSTGTSQTQSKSVPAGSTTNYFVRLQNDGNIADRIRVNGTALNMFDRRVRYYAGQTDVTSQVVAGTYQTPLLGAGGVSDLRVEVFFSSFTVSSGETITVTATSTATGFTTVSDTVKMVAQVDPASQAQTSSSSVALSSVSISAAHSEIVLRFFAPLDANSASDATHYSVVAAGRTIEVDAASYSSVGNMVTLALPLGSLNVGDKVSIAWSNLRDGQGRLLTPGQVSASAR
jgi:hypothetical protein